MAYDEFLSERVERALKERSVKFQPKKMFGGICYMVDDKMCIGIVKDELMARIDPESYSDLLKKEGAKEMDFTNRPMKGFIFVESEGLDTDDNLEFWVDHCLVYNPKAKSSKKSK